MSKRLSFMALLVLAVCVFAAPVGAVITLFTGSVTVPAAGVMTLNQVSASLPLCTNGSKVVVTTGCGGTIVTPQSPLRGFAIDTANPTEKASTQGGIASDGTNVYIFTNITNYSTNIMQKWTLGAGSPPFTLTLNGPTISDAHFSGNSGPATLVVGGANLWAGSSVGGAGGQNYITSFSTTTLAQGSAFTIPSAACEPTQMAWDSTNSLVYFDCISGNIIYKMTTAGTFTAVVSAVAHNSFTFGPDGNLWLTTSTPSVLRYNSSGTLLSTYTSANVTNFPAGGTARALAFDGSNNPWVIVEASSGGFQLVQMSGLTPTTSTLFTPLTIGSISLAANNPARLAYNTTDNTLSYFASPSFSTGGALLRFSSAGALLGAWWDYGNAEATSSPDIALAGAYTLQTSAAGYGAFEWETNLVAATGASRVVVAHVFKAATRARTGTVIAQGTLYTLPSSFSTPISYACTAGSPGAISGSTAVAAQAEVANYSASQVYIFGDTNNAAVGVTLLCAGV